MGVEQGEPIEQALGRELRPIVRDYLQRLEVVEDTDRADRITKAVATVMACFLEGKHPPTVCSYCGRETTEPDPAKHQQAILAHLISCDLRPEKVLIQVAEGYRGGLRKWLTLAQTAKDVQEFTHLAAETREILDAGGGK